MKQITEDLRTGSCSVVEVPCPQIQAGMVLVRNHSSLISTGTEGGTVKLGKMSWLGKARARPEQARKVLQVVRQQGALTAFQVTMRALQAPVVLGYSSAGTVVAVADDVSGIAVGDTVACGGSGYANHAEIVCVPQNLVVPLPEGQSTRHGCFAFVGAIALQSIRIAEVGMGDTVGVIGLGLLGQLTMQLLQAAGCRVIGFDVDPRRMSSEKSSASFKTTLVTDQNVVEQAMAFSHGYGLDAVIITAATEDNGPVALAGEMLRRKGRAVAVGRTQLTAPRDTYLFKELQLRTSMSAGPGTGDPLYEQHGVDYPFGYVRWTEGRNMQAFLELAHAGRLELDSLISHEFNIDAAGEAFGLIAGKNEDLSTAIILNYPLRDESLVLSNRVDYTQTNATAVEYPSYSVIGAGSFASNELLPLIKRHHQASPRLIVSHSGVKAEALARQYGFAASASNADEVLNDQQTRSIYVLTRHDTHASLAAAALDAGRHVFVEKPLALTKEALTSVEQAWRSSGKTLMVGFNRRWAPLAIELKSAFARRAQPLSILYRANVGYRPPEHWLHDPVMGGGVIVGEACHHIDFCCWLTESQVVDCEVRCLGKGEGGHLPEDNAHISLVFADGSLATIIYISNGSRRGDAERVEVTGDNQIASLTDFATLSIAGKAGIKRRRSYLYADKGHAAEIIAFYESVSGKRTIDTEGMLHSSWVTLDVAEKLREWCQRGISS